MSKFLGFLLGVAVALAGPAVFGVLAAPGGIELNAKEMALAFGIGALIFWAVVSYFSGAGALGAFVAFGTLVYCWLWIPNRTTNFLNDVPGVTSGMIDGSKQYTLNGVVPLLGVISLVYAVQLIVRGVQRRRRERVDAERLQREQEAVQAQQEADAAAVYPVAGSTYPAPPPYESHTSYDDLFDEPEPEPVKPRNQADEQTALFPVGGAGEGEQTAQFPGAGAGGNESGDQTVVAQAPTTDEQEQKPEPTQEPEAPREPTTPNATGDADRGAAGAGAAAAAGGAAVGGSAPAEAAVQADAGAGQAAAGAERPEAGAGQAEAGAERADEPVAAASGEPVQEEQSADGSSDETRAVPAQGGAHETQVMPAGSPVDAAGKGQQQATEENGNQPADAKDQQVADMNGQQAADGKAQQVDGVSGQRQVEKGERRVGPQEKVGAQYRERMEDPEDTGEFHLAFEKPIVRPA
ncbi:hypothetical protein [Kribbella solani]|uniref:hypothetical protein n=1 Tax=Kribbella solani TaxID=236067 RepID=UPI0029A5A35D|nr:hypothetical protein [Kribbella solani]MDX2972764.1 hypothetical protein [Kribbella solani]